MTLPLLFATAAPATAPAAGTSGAVAMLILFVSIALAVSFMCSILEAALLSIREVELEERARRKDSGAITLLDIKRNRLDDAISAILILNTIAHTAGVAGAGLQAGKIWPDQPFMLGVVFPSVLTLLILVGTEIIPKTLGAVNATRLVRPVAILLVAMMWTLKPLLLMTRLVTGAMASHERKPVSRGELAAMVAMATRQGTLAGQDSRLVSNALHFHEIQVDDIMTPRTVVSMMSAQETLDDFLIDEGSTQYSRIPLYGEDRDHVTGYVIRREILSAVARGVSLDTPLEEYQREILFFDQAVPVSQALRKLIEEREHLGMVTDSYGGIAGLLTLEDLVETLLGVEILDESDKVADLRKEANALRERRLENRLLTAAELAPPRKAELPTPVAGGAPADSDGKPSERQAGPAAGGPAKPVP